MAWLYKANLKGPALELQETLTHIQWRVAGSDAVWEDLVPLSDLQGLPGVNAVDNDTAVAGYVSSGSGSATQTAGDQRWLTTLNAVDAGVVGDGTTDDATALQSVLNSAATFGLSVTLEPLSVVLVQTTIVVPSGTHLNLNGATIKRGATGSGGLFNLTDKSNIILENGTLDGDKASYATATEFRHNIILDNSQNITLRDLKSLRAKGDGVYVGGTTTSCVNVNLFNTICDANHRNGMSIVGVDGLTATGCRFTSTSGTDPQAGVDVEPNRVDQICTNIAFTGCTFAGNTKHGFLVALQTGRTATQGRITLTGCSLDGNTVAGVRLTESEGFKMVGGSLSNNFQGILHDTNTMKSAKFIGVTVEKNKQHGVAVTGVYSDLLVADCTFDLNGQTTTGDGINIAPSATSTNLRLVSNRSGGATQRNGLTLGANCSGVAAIGNQYVGNGTAARSGQTVITLDLDEVGKRVITGSRGGNAALAALLTQMAGMGFITDSTSA